MKRKVVVYTSVFIAVVLIGLIILLKNDSRIVFIKPSGFISLSEVERRSESDGLRCKFFEEAIFLVDFKGRTMYQTIVQNSDFVVKFKNEYYINEKKYLEVVESAKIALEEQQRIYHIGDTIEIRGAGETVYMVKILSTEVAKKEEISSEDSLMTYHIKYSVEPNDIEAEMPPWFIRWVELSDGSILIDVEVIDEETVSVSNRIKNNSEDVEVVAIILGNPEYLAFTYRVLIKE